MMPRGGVWKLEGGRPLRSDSAQAVSPASAGKPAHMLRAVPRAAGGVLAAGVNVSAGLSTTLLDANVQRGLSNSGPTWQECSAAGVTLTHALQSAIFADSNSADEPYNAHRYIPKAMRWLLHLSCADTSQGSGLGCSGDAMGSGLMGGPPQGLGLPKSVAGEPRELWASQELQRRSRRLPLHFCALGRPGRRPKQRVRMCSNSAISRPVSWDRCTGQLKSNR